MPQQSEAGPECRSYEPFKEYDLVEPMAVLGHSRSPFTLTSKLEEIMPERLPDLAQSSRRPL